MSVSGRPVASRCLFLSSTITPASEFSVPSLFPLSPPGSSVPTRFVCPHAVRLSPPSLSVPTQFGSTEQPQQCLSPPDCLKVPVPAACAPKVVCPRCLSPRCLSQKLCVPAACARCLRKVPASIPQGACPRCLPPSCVSPLPTRNCHTPAFPVLQLRTTTATKISAPNQSGALSRRRHVNR